MIIETKTPQETFDVGKKIGENAKPGQIYTLTGDLGVGKTVFTQGVAAGLGITEPICSPTFTIIQEILPENLIKVTIEKDLDKGFDYRKITVTGLEEI